MNTPVITTLQRLYIVAEHYSCIVAQLEVMYDESHKKRGDTQEVLELKAELDRVKARHEHYTILAEIK